jgi:CRP-like cAMP-binding protein
MYKSGHVSLPTDFIAGLRSNHVSEILRAAKARKFGPREIIMREGTAPSHLFFLKSGRVKFYRLTDSGEEVLLSNLVPGDVFGLGNLLVRPVPYIGTAQTLRDSELLIWDQSRIRRLAQKYPRLAQNALGIALRYLAEHFDRLVDVITCTAEERIAHVLLHVCKENGAILPTGAEIAATNDEIAAEAHVSSFTVSRLLNRWAKKGILRKSRGKVFVKSPEQLISH